jgi:hypothetical protein
MQAEMNVNSPSFSGYDLALVVKKSFAARTIRKSFKRWEIKLMKAANQLLPDEEKIKLPHLSYWTDLADD